MTSTRRRLFRAVGPCCLLAAAALLSITADVSSNHVKAQAAKPDSRTVDLMSEAISVKLTKSSDLRANASSFDTGHTSDYGWAIKVANANPRTPAVSDGVVVVGGGKSHNVYGIDAKTGRRKWTARSKDSGISSISISGDSAFYTTWSCTLERVQISTGKIKYVKWIAGTVECAPHAEGDVVAAAYTENGNEVSLHSSKTGKTVWKKNLNSPVVTAPVLHDGQVFATSTDGSVSKLNGESGANEWTVKIGAVAPPVFTKWGMLVTAPIAAEFEAQAGDEPQESKQAKSSKSDRDTVVHEKTASLGSVASVSDRQLILIDPKKQPGSFKGDMPVGPQLSNNLDYQGVSPGVGQRHIVFANHGEVAVVNPMKGKTVWKVKSENKAGFVQPLIHKGLVILARKDGVLAGMDELTGDIVWCYRFDGRRFGAAPCVDNDRVFITTMQGELLSVPMGSQDHGDAGPKIAEEYDRTAREHNWAGVKDNFVKQRKEIKNKEIQDREAGPSDSDLPAKAKDPVPQPAPVNDPTEGLTKKAWDRREERKANRPRPNGRKYEKQKYPGR